MRPVTPTDSGLYTTPCDLSYSFRITKQLAPLPSLLSEARYTSTSWGVSGHCLTEMSKNVQFDRVSRSLCAVTPTCQCQESKISVDLRDSWLPAYGQGQVTMSNRSGKGCRRKCCLCCEHLVRRNTHQRTIETLPAAFSSIQQDTCPFRHNTSTPHLPSREGSSSICPGKRWRTMPLSGWTAQAVHLNMLFQ